MAIINGTEFNDTLAGENEDDQMFGYGGDDSITGLGGNDYIMGDAGNDTLEGGDGDDGLDGGTGNDILSGGQGNDEYTFWTGSGADTIYNSAVDNSTTTDALRISYDSSSSYYDFVKINDTDLQIRFSGTTDSLTLAGWFSDVDSRVDQFYFWDSWTYNTKTYTAADIEARGYSVYGTEGSDTLTGTSANDYMFGYGENDSLNSGAGNDMLDGGAGNDLLEGGEGDDYLYGGTGNDDLIGGQGNDTYVFNPGDGTDRVFNLAEDNATTMDVVNFSQDISSNYFDSVKINDTDLQIRFYGTTDTVTFVGWFSDVDSRVDQIGFWNGSTYSWVTYTSAELEARGYSVYGTEGSDTLTGTSANDYMFGYGENDSLNSGAGNDMLDGGIGADTMLGDDGNDTYIVDNIGDEVTEGASKGTDTIQSSVTFALGSNVENLILTGTSAINGTGNSQDNRITGNSADNTLNGGTGADIMTGGAGNDTYMVDNTNDFIIENANEGIDTVISSVGYGLYVNLENMTLTGSSNVSAVGNDLDNVLTGNDGNNNITGGAGADTMIGGMGDDNYFLDNIGDIVTENENAGMDKVYSNVSYTLGANIENLSLEDTAIDGIGNELDNNIVGNYYNNNLIGGGGNDTLNGGQGSDVMIGGTGNDTYYFDGGDVVTEYAYEGTDTIISFISHVLGDNLENLVLSGAGAINGMGNDYSNVISVIDPGYNVNNIINGGIGLDTMKGGLGNDTYVVDNVGDVVIENANEGTDTIQSSVTYTLSSNIEKMILIGASTINATGNGLANALTGNSGDNILDGGLDVDTMTGGLGDDTYVVDNIGDIVTENAGEGTDTVKSSITYTLGANIENLTFIGSTSIDGTGNALDNFLIGNSAANILDGGLGEDTLMGDMGNDTYVFRIGSGQDTIYNYDSGIGRIDTIQFEDIPSCMPLELYRQGNDFIIKYGNYESTDTVTINMYFSDPAYQIDRFVFSDDVTMTKEELFASYPLQLTEDPDVLYSGPGNDWIMGLGGDDTIYGEAGNDNLDGGEGNDLLDGDVGSDTLAGGTGSDTYVFRTGSGQDTIYQYDWGTDRIDTIRFADIPSNSLTRLQRQGSDLIITYGESDSITIGMYFYNEQTHRIDRFTFSDGVTMTQSELFAVYPIRLTDEDDNLIMTDDSERVLSGLGNDVVGGAGGNDWLYGESGDDWLFGDTGSDLLDGDIGNDTLAGGEGYDSLFGGSGNDVYEFNYGDGIDSIYDVSTPMEGNKIVFGENISAGNLSFERDSYNGVLTINVGTNGDAVRLTGFDQDEINGSLVIRTLQFANGDQVSLTSFLNRPPVVDNPIPDQSTPEDALFDFTIPANSFRDPDAGDSLTYSATMPSWLSFNADTRTFSGTPTNNNVGTQTVTVTATDMSGAYVTDSFDVTVINVNDAPTVENHISDKSTLEDEPFSFTVPADTFNDVDAGDSLTYTATMPTWLSFNATTRTFSGTPDNNNVGTQPVTITATDTSGAYVTDSFDVTVINVNDAPTVANPINNQTAMEDVAFSYTVPANTFNDIDVGDNLTYSIGSTLPSWLSFNAATRTFSGTPVGVGAVSVTIIATDNSYASVSNTFNINVQTNVITGDANANNLTGTIHNNIMYGLGGNDTLNGGAGNDTLDGGTGADSMIGGTGDDVYVVDTTSDKVVESTSANEGSDTVQSSIAFTLGTYIENLTLTGTSAINGTGNTLNNYMIGNSNVNTLTGNSGNDTLDGGDGADSLVGGTGNDTYIVDNTGDKVTESLSAGTDTVLSSVTFTLGSNVEYLTLTGTTAINGTGNTLANRITGNSANNTLSGGSGADTMIGGAGDDIYIVDNTGDVITESTDEGIDSVQSSVTYTLAANVENLTLTGTSTRNGTGNTLNNYLTGNSAVNTLTGGAGNDTLDGGTGADSLVGGTGDDVYIVDNTSDKVVESTTTNEGTDTVRSSITYTLGTYVENLTLIGTSAINGTGNTLDNTMIGNSNTNTLTGNNGNDTLAGGLSNDILTGGNGSDTYLFGNADGLDTINETAGVSGDIDALKLTEASTTDPVIVKDGNDLYVFIDSGNYMKIASEFQQTNYGIERLEVSDGHYITRTDIQTIVDTMNDINNSGMDIIQKYDAMMNSEDYQNVLAASWHQ
jgi:Ca2+-binding RTX toxin-like protein